MSLSKEEILKIFELARLSASDDNLDKLINDFNSILEYVAQLSEVDTEGVDPLSHVHGINNIFRQDLASNELTTEEALANVPERSGSYIKVPLIIEEES